MPPKIDPDTTPGVKLLRLFRKLLLDRRRHYQSDLAEELQCSPQTVIRLAGEVEAVVGASLHTGLDNRRRWYQYVINEGRSLGLDFEELRFLGICREMASGILPAPVLQRVDSSLRHLALHMADPAHTGKDDPFHFYAKGRIDYTPHTDHIEHLVNAARSQKVCLVAYKGPGREEPREHRVVPLRMIAMNNALYMLGALVDEDFTPNGRTSSMAVHRIADVTTTGKRVAVPLPEDDLDGFGLPWHEPRSFSIRFSAKVAEYVRERNWADNQIMENTTDGGLVLTLTTRAEPELRAWVRSFGENATLIEDRA